MSRSCSVSNGEIISTREGANFMVSCGTGNAGPPLTVLSVNSFTECMESCGTFNKNLTQPAPFGATCGTVSFDRSANSDNCFLKTLSGVTPEGDFGTFESGFSVLVFSPVQWAGVFFGMVVMLGFLGGMLFWSEKRERKRTGR